MPNFYNRLRARKFNSVSDTALEIAPSSSATPNFTIDAGGKLNWSSGSANADTNLYRSASNTLKTDDSFDVASGHSYKIDGTDVVTSTALGSGIAHSHLTSVGNLTSLNAATPSFTGPLNSSGDSTFSGTLNITETANFSGLLDSTGSAVFTGPVDSTGGFSAATPNFYGPLYSDGVATFQNTLVLQQSMEKFSPIGSAVTGTVNIDVLNSAVYIGYTSSGNFTFNFRGNNSTSLDSLMGDNKSMTVAIFVVNTTARSLSAVQIDGNPQSNIRWFGGAAPSGNSNATDVYTFTISKTTSGLQYWTVYASQSKFGQVDY